MAVSLTALDYDCITNSLGLNALEGNDDMLTKHVDTREEGMGMKIMKELE